jgi:hypothetical protein
MGLSNPTKNIYSITETTATGTGTKTYGFIVPQDTMNIVVRVWAATVTTVTADIFVQTSEDDGTTWRYCAHFTQVTAAIPLAQASFVSVPVYGTLAGNVLGTFVGSVASTSLAASRISGLPIMGQKNRIVIQYGGGSGTNDALHIDVFANAQDLPD